ncbi:hypothetical protein A8L33_11160 [Microbacterium aurantiacum]|nr:hypothetical protein A8L33_11160 [Microbacterium chocolatum]
MICAVMGSSSGFGTIRSAGVAGAGADHSARSPRTQERILPDLGIVCAVPFLGRRGDGARQTR